MEQEVTVLKTRWDHIKKEDVPLYWVDGRTLIYDPRTEWETRNLHVNGFRKNSDDLMAMPDSNAARAIAHNTSIGGLA